MKPLSPGKKRFPNRTRVTDGRQTVAEEFFPKVTVDIGGAPHPLILGRKTGKNEGHLIIDPLRGPYDFSRLEIAKQKSGVVHIKQEISSEKGLPLRKESAEHIDCRQVYNGGKMIDPDMLAGEARRVLKKEGTIIVSGRKADFENTMNAFEEKGFKAELAPKPETKFEKMPARDAEEQRSADEKRLELLRRIGASRERISETRKMQAEKAKKIEDDIFIVKFRKK